MAAHRRPNVIVVITDDQGYGDLGCTGNPWIRTPNLDAFHDDSVRFTDFHVSPLCAPTRGAIMTGRRPLRNGVWATAWGRSLLRRTETTLPQLLAANGYRTGMFGKWHLGDNYPYRPQDRGFQHVVAHKGGGVGQTPDFWGNDYFDDTYWADGKPCQYEGYCTDIWFEQAIAFMESCGDAPFFAYVATNAPHHPYLVARKYSDPYRHNTHVPNPEFYGMIANIDENFGKLRAWLRERGLEENTILIFMTDNGTSAGWPHDDAPPSADMICGYNGGMRGRKGSYYDGGHRVPFFIGWPAAGVQGGRDVGEMALHVDLLPTLLDLCGCPTPRRFGLDGMSLADLVRLKSESLPDRITVVQYRQNTETPEKWTNAVMSPRWRLIGGRELYDIKADPGQIRDVAGQRPEIVEKLRAFHDDYWGEVAPQLADYCPISLGNEAENPTRLDAMDVMGDIAWNQGMVIAAARSTGKWAVDVDRAGWYRFRLRRWPEELNLPIDGTISDAEAARNAYAQESKAARIRPARAQLKLFDTEAEADIAPGAREATFELNVPRTGRTTLEAWFLSDVTDRRGAYYVYVERMPK